jgi:fatty-acyl-CoA synthase
MDLSLPLQAPLSPLQFLQRSADVWADRPAVAHHGSTWTYEQFRERVERLAGALRGLGVGTGDRVATLLPNVPAMLELHYAVPWCGGVLVPLNPRLSGAELGFIVEHSGARVLVADEALRDTVAHVSPDVKVVFVGGDSTELEDLAAGTEPLPLALPAETDLLSINYTSGTTGRPKGVMYVHRGSYLHALGMLVETRLTASSKYLWTLPMFHCNGWAFTWAVTAAGGCHVCLDRFDPELVWGLAHAGSVTHLCGAPTVLTMLCESPSAAPAPQRIAVYTGGAPPTPTLLERTAELNLDVTQLYGLTETYGPIAVCARRPGWEQLDPAARALLQARQGVGTVVSQMLRVVDEDLVDVPRDGETLGEVVMRGNNVMAGYYRDPDATAAAFRGGWFHSGDLGVMHEDGYVELRDRLKDMIISGGENISTIEVERALCAHPDVLEAAVVGLADERWGEIPKAFVVLRDGSHASAEDLQEWVRGRLARFKVPRAFAFVGELPKTATGKIEKWRLRTGE